MSGWLRLIAVDVDQRPDHDLVGSELFSSASEASAFFQAGSIGWSPGRRRDVLQGLELCTNAWRVEPVTTGSVSSSYFDDSTRFPKGSLHLDCTLLMRNVPVTWRRAADLRCDDVAHVRDRRLHHRVPAGARGDRTPAGCA